jgi:hypothetical protein
VGTPSIPLNPTVSNPLLTVAAVMVVKSHKFMNTLPLRVITQGVPSSYVRTGIASMIRCVMTHKNTV